MGDFALGGRTFRGRFFIAAALQVVFLIFASNLSNCYAEVEDTSMEDQLKEESRKDPDSIKGHLALAKFYLDRDDFLKAEEAFKKALGINPSEAKAFDGLGVIYLRKDDTFSSLDKAIKFFSRAIEIDPKNGKALAHWGEAVAEKSRATADYAQKKAILELIKKTLEENPTDADVYQSAISCFEILGAATYDENLNDKAIWLYAKALAFDSKSYGARTSLARIYMTRGNYKEATKLLNEAVEISPRRSDVYRILAELYEAQGVQALAEKEAKQALEINPNKGGAYGVLAKVYAAQGKTLESEEMIELMLALNPQRVDSRLKAVSFYFSVKNYSKMDEALSKALALDSKNGETYLWRARLYLAQGQEKKAEESFRKAAELSPKNEKVFAELGAFYQERRDAVNAQAYSRKALELSLENKQTPSSLQSSLQSSLPSSLVDDLKKKLLLNPRDEVASVALASIYVEQGRLVDAEGLLAYVIRLNPKNDEALAEMGWLELRRKNKTRAGSFFARSLQINPKNKTALRGMQGPS